MEIFNDFEDFSDDKKEEFFKVIGKNVSRIRKKHKLSQLKLSQLIGHKSTSLLSGAEIYYKKQHFSLEHLALIAFVLNEDIMEFFRTDL
jgi:transcriptional regulator with XRE-family HTH domain